MNYDVRFQVWKDVDIFFYFNILTFLCYNMFCDKRSFCLFRSSAFVCFLFFFGDGKVIFR